MILLEKRIPIEDTQLGKELIGMGKVRGIEQGSDSELVRSIPSIAERRFRRFPKSLLSQLSQLTLAQKSDLLTETATCDSLADLKAWLKRGFK